MAAAKGRGFAYSQQVQELRRPGEVGVKQQFSDVAEKKTEDAEKKISEICDAMSQINVADSTEKLKSFTQLVSPVCKTSEDLEKCVSIIFDFAVKSKWNAHLSAIFCNYLGDIATDGTKFRTVLLRKLQTSYKDRNKKYLELEKFLLDAAFLCEIFHHMQIEGCCLKVLAHPIIDYFGMLVDGASFKETE
ncbi:CBP80/20-dependent translation initiation factor, partial [Stegodyphus mimosarum]